MLQCNACSVVITPPSDRATATSDYYEEQYSLTHTVLANTEMHRYFRYPEYARLIGEALEYTQAPGSWLDVGCDHGFFLDDVRRYGFSAVGVEPSQGARTYARQIGLEVHESLDQVADSFSAASMWHVLEHIEDPLHMLTQIHERLLAGGLLMIRVPNAGGFWSRILRDRWIWFQPHHHVVHYTAGTLQAVVERAGYSVLTVREQRPNSWFTRRAYRLSAAVFTNTLQRARPSVRDRLARAYQDITGQELLLIAKRP